MSVGSGSFRAHVVGFRRATLDSGWCLGHGSGMVGLKNRTSYAGLIPWLW